MTLEKSSSFFQFIYKRWLRLFPSMLIVTLIVFLTARYLPERPLGIPSFSSIIPGLLFLEPNLIKLITGYSLPNLDNSFWSLYVEVKFYLVFGLFYFFTGKIYAIIAISVLFLISLILLIIPDSLPFLKYYQLLSPEYFGWFSAGALAYLYFVSGKKGWLFFSILLSFLSSVQYLSNIDLFISTVAVVSVFYFGLIFEAVRKFLSTKFLLFLGFISYPFYLIHQNTMVGLIIKINKAYPQIPDILLIIVPFIFLVAVTFYIAKYIEPFLRKKIVTAGIFLQYKIKGV